MRSVIHILFQVWSPVQTIRSDAGHQFLFRSFTLASQLLHVALHSDGAKYLGQSNILVGQIFWLDKYKSNPITYTARQLWHLLSLHSYFSSYLFRGQCHTRSNWERLKNCPGRTREKDWSHESEVLCSIEGGQPWIIELETPCPPDIVLVQSPFFSPVCVRYPDGLPTKL